MSTPLPIPSIELRQITYFLAVVEHRSVSAAARALGITQPALARAISRLESRVGGVLLRRRSTGTVLTAEGARFLIHARLIANDCAHAANEVRAVQQGDAGSVSIFCGASFIPAVISEATRRALREIPGLELHVFEGVLDDMMGVLLEGRCDFVFSSFPDEPPRDDVVLEPLMTLKPTIVAAANHPLARRRNVTMADLVDQAWISMEHRLTLSVFTDLFNSRRLPAPRPLRTNSLVMLKSLLATGEFLAMLPRHVVQREIRAGTVSRIDITTAGRRPVAGLIHLGRRNRSPAVEQVMNIVREICVGQST